MDLAITRITPEVHIARGAKAYDDGLSVNDHGLRQGSREAKDWEYGWHQRRVECTRAQMARAA